MRNVVTLFLILICVLPSNAQSGFKIKNKKSNVGKIKFKLINNTIVAPVKINGTELTFIVDTGANATFLFNTTNIDSLELKDTKKIQVKGFGSSKMVTSVISKNNVLKIGGLVDDNKSLQLILDDGIDFSRRLGVPIHGIIGTDLFKNFVTEINYSSKKLKFYNPSYYKRKRLKRYQELDIEIHKKRYFVQTKMILEEAQISTKMLLDTGSSDAVWIFEDETQDLRVPKKYFDDYIGMGVGGDVYGKRSRLKEIQLGEYSLKNTNLAFPDARHVQLIKSTIGRNGSLGSGLIRRFNLVIDVPNQKLYFKKNSYFNEPFEYDMSGLVVEQMGNIEVASFNIDVSKKLETFFEADFLKIKLVPVFQVVDVRPNSPSDMVGIKKHDIIVSLNNKKLEEIKLEEVLHFLSAKDGKKINMRINRRGKFMEFKFRLKKML